MSFSKEVSTFIKNAKFKSDEEFGLAALQLWVDIVDGTPRITGTLRANWQFGTELNPTQYSPSAEQGAKGRASKKAYSVKLEDTIIIFNNMVYAEVVENGLAGTNRVPRRMVAKAIAAAQARNAV